jgi:hypothetical protein
MPESNRDPIAQLEADMARRAHISRLVEETALSSGERMLGWFKFSHLGSTTLQDVSAIFAQAAVDVVRQVPSSAERTVALRKLLEGKDAAVRAAL